MATNVPTIARMARSTATRNTGCVGALRFMAILRLISVCASESALANGF
jgi:hypothetical protein